MARYDNPITLARLHIGEGLSIPQMAKRLGCSPRTIRTKLKEHNIPAHKGRPASERTKDPPNHILEDDEGYEIVEAFVPVLDEDGTITDRRRKSVRVHRLIAVAYWGFDAVCDSEIHHANGCKIDNRPGNLTPLEPSIHGGLRMKFRDRWADGSTPHDF